MRTRTSTEFQGESPYFVRHFAPLAPLIDPIPVEVEAKIGRIWAGHADLPSD